MANTIENSAEDGTDDLAFVEEIQQKKREAESFLSDWREEAEECYAFVAGDQWTDEEKAYLEENNRVAVVFNRMAPIINAVRGQEVNNRTEVSYIPRRIGVVAVDEMMTNAAKTVRDKCDAEDEDADAFNDLLITGIGCTETRIDYEEDPDGKIMVERRDPLTVRWDPSARKKNLTDRKWEQCDDWLDREELLARWPDADLESLQITAPDNKNEPHDATNAWKYEANAAGYDSRSQKYRVTRHVWIARESYYQVLDPMSGKLVEMGEEAHAKLQDRAPMLGIKLDSLRKTRRVFQQVYLIGSVILEESQAPSQKTFPMKFMTGYRDRNSNTWHGLVRYMRDPQKFQNKIFSLMHHILSSNAKGGLMMEKGAVDNQRKFENEWAKANSISIFKDGALEKGKVQPKPKGEYPVQLDNLLHFSVSSIQDTTGANLELLGMANRDQPGVLEAHRARQSLTMLSVLFDSLRAYRRQHGVLLADFIANYISDGRLIKMVGQEGAKYVQLLRAPETMEYDLLVDEASSARDVKERTLAVLMAVAPQLVAMGIPIPQNAIDYLPIPDALRESWRQQIAQAKQQGPKPTPEMIKASSAVNLQNMKHEHKMQEIQATSQADAQRESLQAQSEQVIDTNRSANKINETIVEHQQQRQTSAAEAALEARLAALEGKIKALLSGQDHAQSQMQTHAKARAARQQMKMRAPATQ